jgi:DNA polymerase-3 subunit alpha
VTVYSDLLLNVGEVLKVNELILIEGEYGEDRFSGELSLSADRIWSLEQARNEFGRGVLLRLAAADFGNGLMHELRDILGGATRGRCPVFIDYLHGESVARLRLGDLAIQPSAATLGRLAARLGGERVQVDYG